MLALRIGSSRSATGGALVAAFVAVQAVLGVLVAAPAHAIGTPDAPTFVEAEQVDDGVVGVIWDAPAFSGSSPLTSYTATANPGGWTCTTADTTPGEEFCFVEGLAIGVSYTFTVVATNADGDSPASDPSPPVAVAPFVVPSAPVITFATEQPDVAGVQWEPAANAGPPVWGYIATAAPGGQFCTTSELTCQIGGLSGVVVSSITVVALNNAGRSAPSAPWIPYSLKVPGAPSDVTVRNVGTTSVTVSWSAAISYGAHPNTYTVTSTPGGLTCQPPASIPACSLQGLSQSTSYTFSVVASNTNGTGPAAQSPAITTLAPVVMPDTLPPAGVAGLTGVGILAADGSVGAQLSWTLPGGADVTRVLVGVVAGLGTPTSTQVWNESIVSRTGATLWGLVPGTTYTVSVYAVDAAGNVAHPTSTRLWGSTGRVSAVPATSAAGAAVAVQASLTNPLGKGLAIRPVDVLSRAAGNGPWRLYRHAVTDARGNVLIATRPQTHTQFALRFAGERGTLGVATGTIATIRVRAAVSAELSLAPRSQPHNARRGSAAKLSGTVSPGKPSQPVYLQVLVGRRWQNLAMTRLDRAGSYSFGLPTTVRGVSRYRVYRPGDRTNLAGASAVQLLTIL